MKLYMHPASTTSRPVMQFIADAKLAVDQQVVDIFAGEHKGAAYRAINPNSLIPLLEDGDFRLSESAAILRYLAGCAASPAYPADLRRRARVDELLDWFNSQFYRDWGYGLVYPQVLPDHRRSDPAVQAALLASAAERARRWLGILNDHWLAGGPRHLLGAEITLADYFGFALVTAGELIHCDFAAYPNIARWIEAMKERPSYAEIYKVFAGFCESTRNQAFARV